MAEQPARRRVFFALWPDETTRRALVRATRSAARRCGGRPTPPANLHVTLAFLGPLTAPLLASVRRVPPLASPAFELVFDQLGYWRGSQALWISPSRVPEALIELEATLWDRLEAAGFERERRPYRPHVTVARKAKPVAEALSAVCWRVSELALVESRPGARHPRYEVLDVWSFEPVG